MLNNFNTWMQQIAFSRVRVDIMFMWIQRAYVGDIVIFSKCGFSSRRYWKSVGGRRKVLRIAEMMNMARKLLTVFVMVLSCGLVVWLWVLGNDIWNQFVLRSYFVLVVPNLTTTILCLCWIWSLVLSYWLIRRKFK